MTRVVKLRTRLRPDAAGIVGTARTDRRTTALLARLSAGDIAVLDQVDLDGPTAEALVEAGVVAVLNRSEMISGRFPNRGPQILVDAGIAMVDQLAGTGGRDALAVIDDGRRVRVLGGSVLVGDEVVAEGRELSAAEVSAQLGAAHAGLATQLQTLTHSSAEFVRREEPLLLHGEGLPRLRTKIKGRPVVVVGQGPDDAAELRGMRRYLREMHPVVIATGDGLEVARAAGLTPDVVVLDSRVEELPAARSLRSARDVVVTEPAGSVRGGTGTERFERIGVRTVIMQTTAAPADAALLLADGAGARPDRRRRAARHDRGVPRQQPRRPRQRLRHPPQGRAALVDATAVPMLYSGQLRARHAYLVLLIGLIAVAAAIATTQVGHQWALDLRDQVEQLVTDLRGRLS